MSAQNSHPMRKEEDNGGRKEGIVIFVSEYGVSIGTSRRDITASHDGLVAKCCSRV